MYNPDEDDITDDSNYIYNRKAMNLGPNHPPHMERQESIFKRIHPLVWALIIFIILALVAGGPK